jgi:hypothetical protein
MSTSTGKKKAKSTASSTSPPAEDPAVAEIKCTSKFRVFCEPVVYTDEQRAAVPALKEEFDAALPEWVDDGMILRFLRQKKFDVDAAAEALTNHIAFVENTPIWDNARVEATLEYRAAIGYVLPAPDYFGRPIIYVRPRLINPAHRANQEEVAQTFLAMVRDSTAICKRFGTEQCVVLYDLEGFAARNRDNVTLKLHIDIMEKQYPDSMGNIVFCRYPWLLFPIFTVAKLWLDKATTERVVFVDDLADLNQLMPKSNIPEGLGGELKERQPDFEIFPKKTGGWFSGWFGGGGGAAPDAAATTAAADDNDEDPLAGLTGEARAAKIAEIEKAELEGAKKIEADAAARDATKAASHSKQRRRRRKNKR